MKNNMILSDKFILSKVKEDFTEYLDVSNETLNTYKKGIECFFNYLTVKNIKQPTRLDLRAFREELKQSSTTNTINTYLTAIRRFFGYLEDNGLYEDITREVKSVKTSRIPKKQVLTLEQSKTIYKSLTNKREKCIFSLAISTGLRGIEMANARIEDIKLHNGEYVLFVKGKKRDDYDEYVKLSSQTLEDIYSYLEQRKSGYIFISESNNNYGNGVTTKTLRREIKKIFKRFGLDSDTFSLHSMRRTFATISYLNGADVKEIQQVLRHRSMATSMRYINQCVRDNFNTELNVSKLVFE